MTGWTKTGWHGDAAVAVLAPGLRIGVSRDRLSPPGALGWIVTVFGEELPGRAASLPEGKATALLAASQRVDAARAVLASGRVPSRAAGWNGTGRKAQLAPGLRIAAFYDALRPRDEPGSPYAVTVFGERLTGGAASLEEGQNAAVAEARARLREAAASLEALRESAA